MIDINIDFYWIKRSSEQKVAESNVAPPPAKSTEGPPIAANTAAVILRYDPVSIGLFQNVIEPCLKKNGLSPLLIESLLPEDTMLDRTTCVLENARIVIALLAGGGGPSVHFRLGVATGLRKQILAFTTSGLTTIGDLCGLKIHIFENDEDLRDQLHRELADLSQEIVRNRIQPTR
jgi:hypothetical protein